MPDSDDYHAPPREARAGGHGVRQALVAVLIGAILLLIVIATVRLH